MGDTITIEEASAIMKGFGKSKLTALQARAFAELGYDDGAREFIIGNTSSGKTLIPLVAFQKAIGEGCDSKLLYIVPYRALAAQKAEEFETIFPECSIRMSTSEYCMADSSVIAAQCDIAIIIYEKAFQFQARDNRFFQRYSHVVFDEIGIIENAERGFKADFLLNCACHIKNLNIYVLATPFYDWTKYISCYSFHVVASKERPIHVKTIPVFLNKDEEDPQKKTDKIIQLCQSHLKQNHKILLFANNKKLVRWLATRIGKSVFPDFQIGNESLISERNKIFSKLDLLQDDILGVFGGEGDISAYKNGIAFHNASLPDELRELIEEDFLMSESGLKIVCATETLAFGINSNVDVVIVAAVHKYDKGEKRLLTPNEIYNYIGRAGRYGIREQGIAYVLLSGEEECKGWENLNQNADDVPVLASTVCTASDRNDKMLQILHLFYDGNALSANEILERIETYPVEELTYSLKLKIAETIRMLMDKRLVGKEYDEFDDGYRYRISDKGKKILGFILETDSYDELANLGKSFFTKKKREFDIIYTLSGCTDIKNIMPALSSDNNNTDSVHKSLGVLPGICTNLKKSLWQMHQKNWISDALYHQLYHSDVLALFQENNISDNGFVREPAPEDWELFSRLRLSVALYMWIDAKSAKEIGDHTNYNYSTMVHMGNKFKYLIDTLVLGFSEKMEKSEQKRFQLLGISLFYGIGFSMLSSMMKEGIFENLNQIEPKDGRQLRAISQTIAFSGSHQYQNKGKYRRMYLHCQGFKENYVQFLNKRCSENMR